MKKTILLVDDVRLFLKLEETFFKRTGCEIMMAQSGTEAFDKAQKHVPDLILLDYNMPDLMGDQVIKKLKADKKTAAIPVIIVSTSASEGDMERCFAAGADDYITKPINAQELLAKAAAILNIPQRVHQRIPVRFQVEGEASGKTFTGYSKNLSIGGLLVECIESLPLETMVTMDLPIKDDRGMITFQGKIVRSDRDNATESYYLGVQFLDLASEHKEAIEHFISYHAPSARPVRGPDPS